jgi:hypothetical protein
MSTTIELQADLHMVPAAVEFGDQRVIDHIDGYASQVGVGNEPLPGTKIQFYPANEDDTASVTSTVHHEHEPFETFQHKAVQLIARVMGRRSSDIQVQHMKGGTFNRVVAVTVSSTKPKKYTTQWMMAQICGVFGRPKIRTPQSFILRIPREEIDDMKYDVAILNIVGSHLQLPIPKVVDFDASTNNELESPYMIQKRLPGQNLMLTSMWKNLSMTQKKSIAKQVIDLVAQIALMTGAPGQLSLDNLSQPLGKPISVEKFCVPKQGLENSHWNKPCTWPARPQKPLEHLLEQCERWREYQTSEGACFDEIWDGFAAISKALEKRGFLDGPNVLSHGDLKAYNLLADVRSPTEADITGVLDWDFAIIAPEFMAYRAPFWLWTPEDMDSTEMDHEHIADISPVTDEDRELKELFQDYAPERYKRFAFAPEAMLARRMYPILKDGIFGPWNMMEAESVIREWDKIHPDDGVAVKVEGLDSDSEFSESVQK